MRVHLTVAPPQAMGEGPTGSRVVVGITGGEFAGDRLSGIVLPGGGDWLVYRRDQCAELDARYCLQTTEGELIYVQDRGLRHGPEHVMGRLARGHLVDPSQYYFRTAARLETSSARYAWLNRTVVIGSGMRRPDGVVIDFFAVR